MVVALLLGTLFSGYIWCRQHYSSGVSALELLHFDRAQQHFESYLKVWPRSGEVHLLAAQAARRGGAYAAAATHLAACKRLRVPARLFALEGTLLHAQQGDFADQEEFLTGLIAKKSPDRLLVLEALAQGYLRVFQLDQAMTCLNLLVQEQPGHYRALLLRGKTWQMLQRYDDTLGDFQRAAERAPEVFEARLHLAGTLHQLGHVQRAIAEYESLSARESQNSAVVIGLARCYEDQAALDAAGQLLDDFLTGHPDDVQALTESARVAFRQGILAKSEELLVRAVHLAPRDREAHYVLHRCLEAQGKSQESQRVVVLLNELDRTAARLATLMTRATDAPRDPTLRYEIGLLLIENGREEHGIQWLYSTLAIDPQYQPAQEALARVLKSARDTPGGLRHP